AKPRHGRTEKSAHRQPKTDDRNKRHPPRGEGKKFYLVGSPKDEKRKLFVLRFLLSPLSQLRSACRRHFVATSPPAHRSARGGEKSFGCCWSLGGMPRSRFLDVPTVAA